MGRRCCRTCTPTGQGIDPGCRRRPPCIVVTPRPAGTSAISLARSGGTLGRPMRSRKRHAGRTRSSPAIRFRALPAAGPSCLPRPRLRLLLPQQCSRCGRSLRQRFAKSRSSISTRITATAPRRSSMAARTCSRLGAYRPRRLLSLFRGYADEPAKARGRSQLNRPLARSRRRSVSRSIPALASNRALRSRRPRGVRRMGRPSDDPLSKLEVSTDAYPRIGEFWPNSASHAHRSGGRLLACRQRRGRAGLRLCLPVGGRGIEHRIDPMLHAFLPTSCRCRSPVGEARGPG